MSDIMKTIKRVLEGQSPDYFIFPNASAFIAEGLDPNEVSVILEDMEKSGEIEREQIVVQVSETGEHENNGSSDIATVGGGYRMKRDRGSN